MLSITPEQVQYLTIVFFGRPADPASLGAWPASGLTAEAVVLILIASEEYKLKTIALNTNNNMLDQAGLINTYYLRLFGRNAAASEVAGWTNALANGQVNIDYLGLTILNAGINMPATSDIKQVLTAKFESAQLYTGILFNNAAIAVAYIGAAAASNGIEYLNTVNTPRAKTLSQAQASIDTLPLGGSRSEQTFTCSVNSSSSGQAITSQVDINSFATGCVIVAGSGNDTIVGGFTADVITTGTGFDQVAYINGNANEISNQVTAAGLGSVTDASLIDRITDFSAVNDQIRINIGNVFFSANQLTFTGSTTTNVSSFSISEATVANLDGLLAAFNAAVAGGAVASSSGTAQAYVFTTGAIAGGLANASNQVFLVLNNSAGTIENSDLLINITGSTGTIGTSNFIYGVV